MPNLASNYNAPFYLFNGHLQTIVPALFYTEKKHPYVRERIDTSDGDFLDLDWIRRGNKRLAILTHGLEGNSQAPYMYHMAEALMSNGWDVLCWNFRSCSGMPNRKPKFYHAGLTSDLDEVAHYAAKDKTYGSILMIAFSFGANLTLKYLGEQSSNLLPEVKKAVVFSAPCDLESSAVQLSKHANQIYMKRFLVSFKQKFIEKDKLFPGYLDLGPLMNIHNFFEFDNVYTAPMFGFKDAHDYYSKASAKSFLSSIKIPTLIVSAKNDPFLGDSMLSL